MHAASWGRRSDRGRSLQFVRTLPALRLGHDDRGIGKLYYAATLEQSSRTIPGGKMPATDTMRRELALPTSARAMPSEQKSADESVSVLEAWARKRV